MVRKLTHGGELVNYLFIINNDLFYLNVFYMLWIMDVNFEYSK